MHHEFDRFIVHLCMGACVCVCVCVCVLDAKSTAIHFLHTYDTPPPIGGFSKEIYREQLN